MRPTTLNLEDIKGLATAKELLVSALERREHIMLVGPPGCGKLMLAARVPYLLPPLTEQEQEEVTLNYLTLPGSYQPEGRPFRAPHHTISFAGLTGTTKRPGELALAHGGVLLLDEAPEFGALQLKQVVMALDAGGNAAWSRGERRTWPAKFTLLAAMNPCICGGGRRCRCSEPRKARWRGRVAPLLEHCTEITVPPLNSPECAGSGLTTEEARERIARAWGVTEVTPGVCRCCGEPRSACVCEPGCGGPR